MIAKGVETVKFYKSLDKSRSKRQPERYREPAEDDKKDYIVVPPGHPWIDSTVSATQRCPFASLSDANLASLQTSKQILSQNDQHRPVAPPSPPATQQIPSPMPIAALETRSLSPSFPPEDQSETRACLPPSRCPIRFLDTLTPEQLSSYFSTHRHEIPRSHEICVRRYRNTDEAKLREMDEKYGGRGEGATGLGGMIKGLGAMHRGLLPENTGKEVSEEDENESQSDKHETSAHGESVKKWADSVSHATRDRNSQAITADVAPIIQPTQTSDKLEDPRDSHFDRDRPLRDIRIGESPSRPWGISVPAAAYEATSQQQQSFSEIEKSEKHKDRRETDATDEDSCSSSRNRSMAVPVPLSYSNIPASSSSTNGIVGKGAVDGQSSHSSRSSFMSDDRTSIPLSTRPAPQHDMGQKEKNGRKEKKGQKQKKGQKEKKGQMLFTGPVFFGYTPEQTVMLLKEIGKEDGREA